MRAVLVVVAAAAAPMVAVASTLVFEDARDDPAAPASTRARAAASATPDPRNTAPAPSPLSTPQPLTPPPVGPYRPNAHHEAPPSSAEADLDELSGGTRRLIQDVDSRRLSAARFTRIALAKMGYGRGVPDRYRGQATGLDMLALSLAVDAVDPKVSPADRARIRGEVLEYVHGKDAAERPPGG